MAQRSKIYAVFATLCGVLAGLVVFEITLRQFSYATYSRYSVEIRQYEEGTSLSHFARTDDLPKLQRRLTGNPYLPGAPVLLLLGDSHLAARQVSDQATMLSLLERRARSDGWLINVAGYGISSGAAPTYCGFSEILLKHWNPEWVIVLLNTEDILSEPLNKSIFYRMKCMPQRPPELYKVPEVIGAGPPSFSFLPNTATMQTLSVRLNNLIYFRKHVRLKDNPAIKAQLPQVPSACITLLKHAYGNRLLVVFFPGTMRTDAGITPEELNLENACQQQQVPFVSFRDEMIRSRDRFIHLTGFHNTLPGYGHLNEKGHRLMAEKIYELLQKVRGKTKLNDIRNFETR